MCKATGGSCIAAYLEANESWDAQVAGCEIFISADAGAHGSEVRLAVGV